MGQSPDTQLLSAWVHLKLKLGITHAVAWSYKDTDPYTMESLFCGLLIHLHFLTCYTSPMFTKD